MILAPDPAAQFNSQPFERVASPDPKLGHRDARPFGDDSAHQVRGYFVENERPVGLLRA